MGTLAEEATTDRGEPATIEAKQMSFDHANNMAYGDGNVIIRYKDAVLCADKVRFNTLTKDAWAEGDVRLNRPGSEWVGPTVFYNFDTQELRADEVRGFFDPVYVRGESIEKTSSNEYFAAHVTLTTCDYEQPHYRVQATRAEIYPGDRVVLHNVTLRLGDVPVFWLPVMVFSLKAEAQPLSIATGVSSSSGFFLLTTTYWRLNPKVQLSVDLDERTQRGFGVGGGVTYNAGPWGEGRVRSYYINDKHPEDKMDREQGIDIPYNRYRVQWEHQQSFTNDVSLTVQVNKLSDPQIIHDFFRDEFRRDREPETIVDVTKTWPNSTLSLYVRPQLNDFFAEVERLPQLTWAVNRMRVAGTPVFYEGNSSAAELHDVPGNTNNPSFMGNSVRLDTFHQLVLPQFWFGWLSVVPRAGADVTYYSRAPQPSGEIEDATRYVYDLGAAVSFKVSRTWNDVHNERFAVNGLRHIIQPFADYQWVPTPNVRSNELFQFDAVRYITNNVGEAISLTRFSPLEFPAFNTIESIDGQNVLRFGVRQQLQTQRDGRPWDLVDLTAWTDWNIEKQSGQSDFSDLFGTLRLRPTEWIALDAFARYDMNSGNLDELNTAVRVANTDRWSVGVGTRYLRDDSNQITFGGSVRLGRTLTAQVYQRVEMETGMWQVQGYTLRKETHDWLIDCGFLDQNQKIGSDDVVVFLSFTLKAYPSVHLGSPRIDFGPEY